MKSERTIAVLHGYLLEGSGSNLWTRSIISSLCRRGKTVHLFCQENHGDIYPFITEMRIYERDGSCRVAWSRDPAEPGRCILHKPVLGDLLPVYVRDRYEEFSRVVPMIELSDNEIETYIERNVEVVARVVREEDIGIIHANHAVLMPEVARRVKKQCGTPFVVMPHGSAIEYAVKKDSRFRDFAAAAFRESAGMFVIGDEIRRRVLDLFPEINGLELKMRELNLGVDTTLFRTLEPAGRTEQIDDFLQYMAGVPHGRQAGVPEKLRSGLENRSETSVAQLQKLFTEIGNYDHKKPDENLEESIRSIDWEHDEIMLFVGRFIAAKGLQAVVTALPDLLEQHPRLRLLAIGHGPQREVMEAFLWALERGDETLAGLIVAHGRDLEMGGLSGSYKEVEASWNSLGETGTLQWFERARNTIRRDTVVFTGYLTHPMLRYLFPCTDISVFPSVVAEAGPLVFLEALASGSFPLGTDFAGMGASIDSTIPWVGESVADAMRLRPDPHHLVSDIADRAHTVLGFDGTHREVLRKVAVDKYDWQSVSERMYEALQAWSE